ncbi:MAG: class I SAM-dependent methyltransferase [Alphaproteobacteria bacterium]|nr:class I SAM-dependent methyltransferase [Alphaproteobacteria bacterium]MBV9967671.1 class I SAM-dependent methyltransferase [Alphaproteobacteria bacterium]
MESRQSEQPRAARFADYIEARRFDPPRPLLIKAAGLVSRKERALDAGAGALNATKYLLSAGFEHVTALDAAPRAQDVAAELADDRLTFVLSRFEDFDFPASRYDLVNAEFSLPFIRPRNFTSTFTKLLNSVKPGGIFTGQLFGPNDSWNVENSGMTFLTRAEAEAFFRDFELVQVEEEDHPGTTKLGEPKHWHIFHIIAKKQASPR